MKWLEKEAANLLVDEVVERGVAVEPVLVEPLVEPVVEVYSKQKRNCRGEVQNLINQHTR